VNVELLEHREGPFPGTRRRRSLEGSDVCADDPYSLEHADRRIFRF